jgi:hypothetical protein
MAWVVAIEDTVAVAVVAVVVAVAVVAVVVAVAVVAVVVAVAVAIGMMHSPCRKQTALHHALHHALQHALERRGHALRMVARGVILAVTFPKTLT